MIVKPLFDRSSNTCKSVKFFKENRTKLSDIIAIYAFFDRLDAVLNNFYIVTDSEVYGDLKRVENPYVVLQDIEGREMWLSGCNCGYTGTGPRGTKSILKILREEETINKYQFTDEFIENISSYRKITMVKKDNINWDITFTNSPFFTSKIHHNRASLLSFRNNLILIQDPNDLWNDSPVAVIERYRAFIPNPTKIMIFPSDELAIENGYSIYRDYGINRQTAYKIIISDSSGRQIWLNTLINEDKHVLKQITIQSILKYCGFETDENTLLNDNVDENVIKRILSWLNTNIRSVPIQPIYLKKKEQI